MYVCGEMRFHEKLFYVAFKKECRGIGEISMRSVIRIQWVWGVKLQLLSSRKYRGATPSIPTTRWPVEVVIRSRQQFFAWLRRNSRIVEMTPLSVFSNICEADGLSLKGWSLQLSTRVFSSKSSFVWRKLVFVYGPIERASFAFATFCHC